MRIAALALFAAGTVLAQDEPGPTETRPATTFSFQFDQGWGLLVHADRGPARVTEAELTKGLDLPTLVDENFGPSTVTPTQPTRPLTQPGPARPNINNAPRRRRRDPIKATGTLALDSAGAWTIRFDRIEYSDPDNRWSIEFGELKITAVNLVVDRWRGARAEWPDRLAENEKVLVDHYLKLVTPQARTRSTTNGIIPKADDPGRALFVQTAVEEQLTALLLARLDGRPIATIAEHASAYPERVRTLATQILDRLTAQARGEIAPSAARARKDRKVADAAWDFTAAAIPAFRWADGRMHGEARATALKDARQRLADIVTASRKTPIREDAWFSAVDKELADLNAHPELTALAQKATVKDVLAPLTVHGPEGRYSYEEKLVLKDGELVSSKVDAAGLARGQIVRFFDCTTNRWRMLETEYETYWKATVTRK